jgi:hypothetical protein
VIDHGTTTEQAAGSSGGKYGMGGDLIYRWGNPHTYDQGDVSDQKLFNQHDVEWIPGQFPGAGRFLLFNNGVGRPEGVFSTIEEITPSVNPDGSYLLDPTGRFGPLTSSRVYQADVPEEFFAPNISGAQRLRDGNTLITNGPVGLVFEVTPEGEIVWQHNSKDETNPDRRVFRADRHYLSALPPTGMVLDESVSGHWFDPDRVGEGFVIEVLKDGRVLLIWLTYPANATATDLQAWTVGLGYFDGDHIVVENMEARSGTKFGAGFNSDELVLQDWGRVELVFDDCENARVSYSGPPEFGEGNLPMARLTTLHGLACPRDESTQTTDSVEPSLASQAANGSFFHPQRAGEGWFTEYLGDGRVLVHWVTYNLNGHQAWLSGLGTVDGERLIVDDVIYVTGTEFGAGFNPADVSIQAWGSFELEFDDCDNGRIRYSSVLAGWGTGEIELTRLTNFDGISCEWPQ